MRRGMPRAPIVGVWALLLALSLSGASRAAELVMFEQAGCEWCAAWDRQIGPIYPKTAEGRRAPLRRVDLHADRPGDLRDIQAVRFTPTFVLIDGGREVGRIRGYPGEDFFWGLLGDLIGRLPAQTSLATDPPRNAMPAAPGGKWELGDG